MYAICNGSVSECCQTELSSTDLIWTEQSLGLDLYRLRSDDIIVGEGIVGSGSVSWGVTVAKSKSWQKMAHKADMCHFICSDGGGWGVGEGGHHHLFGVPNSPNSHKKKLIEISFKIKWLI